MRLFSAEIEAFPSNRTIYINMTPVDSVDEDTFYELELNRDEKLLALFLKKARAMLSPNQPILKYMDFARGILHKNVGNVYIDQGNINSVIDVFHKSAPAPDQIPQHHTGTNAFMTESVILDKNIYLNEKIVPKGQRITFYYKGKIDERIS